MERRELVDNVRISGPAAVDRLWIHRGEPVRRLSVFLRSVAVGALVFAGMATFLAAFLASAAGSLRPWVSLTSLLLGGLVGVWAARSVVVAGVGQPDDGVDGRPIRLWDALALGCFAAAALRQFVWLVYERGAVLYTLLPNNYGDLPLHWTYVRYLANGAAFWPENPIAAGERLRYPFGVDLLTALFVQLGVSLPALLVTLGVAASALAAAELHGWGRGFAAAAFLFSGGLGGLRPLAGGLFAGLDESWKNLFLALYVPQRGFLFALPAGLLLLASGREHLLRGRRGLPAWVFGLLWGVLPLFHLHTFLFVSVVLGLWAVAGRRIRPALPALAGALLPAAWGAWQVSDGFRAASLVKWNPGWTIGAQNPLAFLGLNFGLFLPLALWALVRALRERSEHVLTLGPGLALFAALFFVKLAPWAWDNTKVMLWCYLLVLPGLEALVLERLRVPVRAAVLVGLLLPGAVAVLAASREPTPRLEVLHVAETDGVCRALAGVPPGDRVATVATFNHPVALCGHPLVAGYAGHLWSHGIDDRSIERTQRDLEALMRGEPDWRPSAQRVRAKLLFWGAREAREYPLSPRPWEATRPLVAEGSWGRLYRLVD